MSSVLAALRGLRDALSGFDAAALSGEDAARLATELASAEKVCATARAKAAARAAQCEGVRAISRLARESGTTTGQVRTEIETVTAAREVPGLEQALDRGEVSLAQGSEIAKTEAQVPGSAQDLLETAKREGLTRLREKARHTRQGAMDEDELRAKRLEARSLRHFEDDLGMTNVHLRLVPEVGHCLLNRIEARAQRRFLDGDRKSSIDQRLADAFVDVAEGQGTRGRTELVVVGHVDALARGHAKPHEPCHVVGGPRLSVHALKDLARDALVTTVLDDEVEVKTIARHGRHVPPALRILLEIGEPPAYLGATCKDCGNRFRLQVDHVDPLANGGLTELVNLTFRCPPCHLVKTEADLRAGKLGKGRKRSEPP